MEEKERILKVLKGEKIDRPPVICPGGMMNAAVTEVVKNIVGNHNVEKDSMVEAAKKVREITGFENYGVPFCMTCEAEPFGIDINLGDKFNEPRVVSYNENNIEKILDQYTSKNYSTERSRVVLDSIEELSNGMIPVVGNITGPISTASSVLDPLKYFKMLRKRPEEAFKFTKMINDHLINYAIDMKHSGADIIAISDPTATGEILGEKNFNKFAMPMYRDFIAEMKKLDIPVILHICGDAKLIISSLNTLEIDVLSFDSIVNMRYARKNIDKKLMGNVSTLLLEIGEIKKIKSITNNAIDSGVDIVSPACGLGMATPIKNLRAMTDTVKEFRYV